jgi:hypothetical protein
MQHRPSYARGGFVLLVALAATGAVQADIELFLSEGGLSSHALEGSQRNFLPYFNGCGTPVITPGNAVYLHDMNCDGSVTFADIDAFVEALAGETTWAHAPCPWLNADCNADASATFADIDGFVARIGTNCP